MKRRQLDADQKSNATSYRLRKPVNAEQHKKRIFEVVNNLNEEELEKISEMLKVSEALDRNEPLGEDGDHDGEVRFDEDVDGNEAEQQDQVDDLVSSVQVKDDDQLTSVSRRSLSSKSMVISLSKQL